MHSVLTALKTLNIPYALHEHPPLFTCEDAEAFYGKIPAGSNKNLFLRNRKGDQHYLLIVSSTKKADLKKIAEAIGESQLGFASPERLMKYLHLTPGSVSPFGLIHDIAHHILVLIDEDLWTHDRLLFHPNQNTSTVELARTDFERFLNETQNAWKLVTI
ncbi:MAG: YbaK/prolyl-tRNA synthetase associated region [uncultured bacterium]|nr:MAG: YbaK/prolyl-tRNA synthetase associated region [uncultured bacterium]